MEGILLGLETAAVLLMLAFALVFGGAWWLRAVLLGAIALVAAGPCSLARGETLTELPPNSGYDGMLNLPGHLARQYLDEYDGVAQSSPVEPLLRVETAQSVAAKTPGLDERAWTKIIIAKWQELGLKATEGVRTPDGSVPDIETPDTVWEVDWSEKWKEGVGQATFYAKARNKQPGLILLMGPGERDVIYYLRALVACGDEIRLEAHFIEDSPAPPPPPDNPNKPGPDMSWLQRPECLWLANPQSVDRSTWARSGGVHVHYTGTIPPDSGWIKAPAPDGLTFERRIFESGRRTAVQYHTALPIYFRDHIYRDVEIRPAKAFDPTDEQSGMEWGGRFYNTANLLFERLWVHHANSNSGEGHGLYVDPSGALTLRNSRIEDCGGQLLQVFNRQWGSVFGPGEPPTNLPFAAGQVRISEFVGRNAGWNPSRGAFALTFNGLGPDADIVIENVDLHLEWSAPQIRSGRQCWSAGGIVISKTDVPPAWMTVVPSRNAGHVHLKNWKLVMKQPRQYLLKVDNVESLTIENSHFEALGGEGLIQIDEPGWTDKDSGKITIRNCTGNAIVYVKGQKVGLVSEGYTR